MLLILPLVFSSWSGLQDVSESFWIRVFSDLSNSSWIDLKTSSKPGSGNTDTNLTATRSLRLSSSASENHPVLYCQQSTSNQIAKTSYGTKDLSKFYVFKLYMIFCVIGEACFGSGILASAYKRLICNFIIMKQHVISIQRETNSLVFTSWTKA